jgi:hypothetical protein
MCAASAQRPASSDASAEAKWSSVDPLGFSMVFCFDKNGIMT